jgi:FkbM family methyltransferase
LFENKVPFRGLRIDVSSPRVRAKTASDLFFGIYERAEIDHVQRFLDPDVDVVELGGSIGVNSTVIRRRMDASRKLVVVEADPDLATQIEKNMQLNKLLTEQVVIESRAIDYSGCTSVPFVREKSNLSGRVGKGQTGSSTIEIPTTTLSSIVHRHKLAEFSLVSDIEGMEIPMFYEDEAALANCRQVLIEIDGVEYNGRSLSVNDIEQRINSLGFDTVDRYYNCIAFQRRK